MVAREWWAPIFQDADQPVICKLFGNKILHDVTKSEASFGRVHNHGRIVERKLAVDTYPERAALFFKDWLRQRSPERFDHRLSG